MANKRKGDHLSMALARLGADTERESTQIEKEKAGVSYNEP